jgi:hypothetical protein
VLPSTVTMIVTETFLMQPTSKQVKPGMQQAPPMFFGHAEFPEAQDVMSPLHVFPFGQHPTGPSPVSVMLKQSSVSPQQ